MWDHGNKLPPPQRMNIGACILCQQFQGLCGLISLDLQAIQMAFDLMLILNTDWKGDILFRFKLWLLEVQGGEVTCWRSHSGLSGLWTPVFLTTISPASPDPAIQLFLPPWLPLTLLAGGEGPTLPRIWAFLGGLLKVICWQKHSSGPGLPGALRTPLPGRTLR